MSRWSRMKNNYFNVLPFVYAPTVCFFITTGIKNESEKSSNKKDYKVSSLDLFFTVLGYSTLGVVTAVTYPVSFPVVGIYIFSKRAIQVSKNQNEIERSKNSRGY